MAKPKKKKNDLITKSRRPLMNYDRNKIAHAMADILDRGVKIKTAAEKYNIPRSTLQDRVHNKVPINCKMGRLTILTPNEETILVRWLIKLAKCGFPRKRDDLLNSVQAIIKADKRPCPFKNQRPGRKWYELFIKRHPELKERIPETISKARAVVSEEYIRKWFRELKSYLTEVNALDILEDPQRIFNGDETSFSMCPKSGNVIAPVGWKNVYDIKSGSEKETITVLLVFSAAGETLTPMVVFPYIRPPKEVINSMHPNWFLGRSETGWMRSEIFFEYIANGVSPWLRENNVKKPVLLLVDGHKSHMTLELSDFCHKNDIILYALPANTTHMMQPADVSVFRPLKVEWRKTVNLWQKEEQNMKKTLNKTTFCPLLEKVLQNDMTNSIKNGFRKCGLYPFNPDAVDYTKCVKNTIENFHELNNLEEVTNEEIDTAIKVIRNLEGRLKEIGIDTDLLVNMIQNSYKTAQINNNKEVNAINATNQKIMSEISNTVQNNEQNSCYQENPKETYNIVITSAEIHTEKNIMQKESTTSQKAIQNKSLEDHLTLDLDKMPIILDNTNKENCFYDDALTGEYTVGFNEVSDDIITTSLIQNAIETGSDISINLIQSPRTSILDIATSSKTPPLRSGSSTPTSRNRVSPYFRTHLFSPKSLDFGKAQKKKDTIPSAISSKAWRDYMQEKVREKEDKENAKQLRKTRIQKNKDEKAKKKAELTIKRDEARKKTSNNRKTKKSIITPQKCKSPTETVSHIKCVGCDEDLISDVEDDDLKNIGCDQCPRWFHLKCTVLRGKPYTEVASKKFVCHVC